MEKELEKLYNEAVSKINKKENKMEFLVFPGKYFKFMVRDRPIIVFSEDEKYAEKANSMKEFSKLIEYLKRNDYKTNLN